MSIAGAAANTVYNERIYDPEVKNDGPSTHEFVEWDAARPFGDGPGVTPEALRRLVDTAYCGRDDGHGRRGRARRRPHSGV
jgi:hypothetical protein